MKNWVISKKTVLIFRVVALGCFCLYFLSLYFVLVEIKKIENYYSDTQSKSAKEDQSRVLRSVADSNKETIKKLRDFFVQKGDEVKFIEQIENLARQSGIKFEISSIEPKVDDSQIFKDDLIIKMNLEGSWSNIIKFVNGLEKMHFGVMIQDLSLDTKLTAGWSGFVRFVIFKEK
jgi:Tfp pilus assembly protein PilO